MQDAVAGALLIAVSLGLFTFFWPRPGRPKFYERSPFMQDIVPFAALSGVVLGAMMLAGPLLR